MYRYLPVIADVLELTMKNSLAENKPKRGRPKTANALARPHRIVTFVTDNERSLLEQVAMEEERSMAAVVHRIIKSHFATK